MQHGIEQAMQQAYVAVAPAASKEAKPSARRAGRGWTVRCVPPGTLLSDDLTGKRQPMSVGDGRIYCLWNGSRKAGLLYCTQDTWEFIEGNDDAITAMQETQARALLPSAGWVWEDVGVAAQVASVRPRRPGAIKTTKTIQGLNQDVKDLVQWMVANPQPTPAQRAEVARQYGALRDLMAELRRNFTEAEGMFETAQAHLIRMLGEDD